MDQHTAHMFMVAAWAKAMSRWNNQVDPLIFVDVSFGLAVPLELCSDASGEQKRMASWNKARPSKS